MTQKYAIAAIRELSEIATGERVARRAGWTHRIESGLIKPGDNTGKVTFAQIEMAAKARWESQQGHINKFLGLGAAQPWENLDADTIELTIIDMAEAFRAIGLSVEGDA
ncbi:MAG: hypothetical protein ABID63_18400 [Pseudomonadota bacterium]